MTRVFPLVTMTLGAIVLLWRFVPFPRSIDPEGKLQLFGLIPLVGLVVLWSILALRRWLLGDGSLLTPLGLLLSCFLSFDGDLIASVIAIVAFGITVIASLYELRNSG